MEFIELADYPLPTGRVTEWLPTAERHWADWPRDHRAISHNHESHLRDALEHNRVRDRRHCWLGHVLRVDGPLDARAWRSALESWVDRHEVLRSHVAVEGGRAARYTLGAGAVRVRPIDAGRPASAMSSYRLVQQLLDQRTSPLDWPAHLCVTIEERDSFTAIIAADHSMMDGYSTTWIGGELRLLYDAARAGRPADLPEAASYLDFCHAERARAEAAGPAHTAVTIWRDFLAAAAGPTTPAATLSAVSADPASTAPPRLAAARPVPQRALAVELLDARATERAAAAAREHGQGTTAALLAAFAAVATEPAAAPEFRTVVPVHTRDEPRWAGSLGWYVGLAPYRIACDTNSLAELITPSGAELRRVRAAASVPFARVCELLGTRPRISFMVSYMDIRGVLHADRWIESETRWLRSRAYAGDEFFFWFLRTPAGLTLNTRYPAGTRATRDVHRHVLRLRELLGEFAEHGDAPLRRAPLDLGIGQGAPAWK
ncbi:condensation domain-containing protein [Nocardia sp. BMG51109]|uniref:condensation domain-containing protein n=1 Tax=Nocardia sp. BMG51109 TaxID=1056816 RepID=UPI0004635146|nr:condensation domain-containing protein [Nocardia sp. BMG51109]